MVAAQSPAASVALEGLPAIPDKAEVEVEHGAFFIRQRTKKADAAHDIPRRRRRRRRLSVTLRIKLKW